MTRAEREMMIGRYMSGGMSSAEEQEFFIQVAVDPELRLDLKAHRTVESAIRKDRDAEPAGHTALRGRIASTLAANPASPGGLGAPSAPAAAIVQTGTGFAFSKWLGGAMVIAATTVAALFLLPLFDGSSDDVPSAGGRVHMVTGPVDSIQKPLAPPALTPSGPSVTTQPTLSAEPAAPRQQATVRQEPSGRQSGVARNTNRSSGRASVRQSSVDTDRRTPERSEHSLPDIDRPSTRRSNGDSTRIGITVIIPDK